MSDSMVRRWVRHFHEECKNVRGDPRSSQPSVVNEDLVRPVTISLLSLHFPQISW
jgi:hypothetical protein